MTCTGDDPVMVFVLSTFSLTPYKYCFYRIPKSKLHNILHSKLIYSTSNFQTPAFLSSNLLYVSIFIPEKLQICLYTTSKFRVNKQCTEKEKLKGILNEGFIPESTRVSPS